jgi:thiol:disulfide interchange protein
MFPLYLAMSRILSIPLFSLFSLLAAAQPGGPPAPKDPVKWTITSVKQDAGSWDLVFTATADDGWYVYSQQSYGDAGPMPTAFAFDTLPTFTLDGPTAETGSHTKEGVDPVFEMKVKKFAGTASFTQRIRTDAPDSPVTGRFDFMTCNDEACIFPDPVYFSIIPSTGAASMAGVPFPKGGAATPSALLDPVKWAVTASALPDGIWRLDFKASVDPGWSIYSQQVFGDGPIPTTILFDSLAHATPVGEPTEAGMDKVEGMDEIFGMTVVKYHGEVTFSRTLRVADPAQEVKGSIQYMICDNEKCVFPDPLPFRIIPSTGAARIGNAPADTALAGQGCDLKLAQVDLDKPVIGAEAATVDSQVRSGGSLWNIFFLGFIGGLLALLTPCVFPMIPLTVSFFTKGSEDKAKGLRNAITYGAFILGIYLLFSLPFHLLGSVSPEIFNEISTNPWLNVAFFVIFLVFAVSFFGYFEITLPSSWVNKMDSNASRFGGAIGIFFMALTLALVSFSCTGPILGSLLAGALTSDGGAWQLTVGMGAFGLALALPFALFALFPGWLNSLPRSGSWLNSVKVILGFAEVALAFKFLSNADLVKHWGLVRYELFMAVWVLCAIGAALYLFGLLRFPHDSPMKKLSPLRGALGALFAATAVYLLLGFRPDKEAGTFTTLKLMSGLAPPVGYSWFMPKECPNGLDCYHDLEAGMAQAKATGKPLLLDFTGYACVNCRKMEEHVWPVPAVRAKIDKEYVLVSLYVDDKTELPAAEQRDYVTCSGQRKRLETRGNKWSTLQTETFINNSQPYYALISPEGVLLTDPVGYTPDAAEYEAFLQRGLQAMQQLKQTAER